ncbi:hypothetical protein [Staphylococcus hominis]|nr:hypothetical protein [Staphylococcus hominis]
MIVIVMSGGDVKIGMNEDERKEERREDVKRVRKMKEGVRKMVKNERM